MVTPGPGPDLGPTLDVLRRIRELQAAQDALLEAVAQRYAIGRNDLRCLEILQREGTMRPQRLADLSHLSPAAITKVADRLVAAGCVNRRPSEQDRRGQLLEVSERHAELRADTWDRVRDDAIALLRSFEDDELEHLDRVVVQLTELNRTHTRRIADDIGS